MADIKLPEDKPRRHWAPRRSEDDDQFITLEEAETKVQATGQWRGTTVEFSDDGENWVEAWLPTPLGEGEESALREHPTHARATVNRKMSDGDLVPTTSVVRWDEYVPDLDDDRREMWDRMPTTLLGKCAKVSCYRGAFRDVIGNRYEPAELHQAKAVQPSPRVA